VLVNDARRHGIQILPVDIQASDAECVASDGQIRLGLPMSRVLARQVLLRLVDAPSDRPFAGLVESVPPHTAAASGYRELTLAGAMISGASRRRQAALGIG